MNEPVLEDEYKTSILHPPLEVLKLYRLLRKSEVGNLSRRDANMVVIGFCMARYPETLHQRQI